MDSQSDSLDIAKLKQFALGGDENDLSQALISEAESQSSLIGQLSHGERVSHQHPPHTNHIQSGIAVQVLPSPNRYVNDTSQRSMQSQELLSSVPNSIPPKMSAGESGLDDTQPIDQSIFEGIISRQKSFHPTQNGGYPSLDAQDVDQESLQMTVKEGEPGHINLLDGFDSKQKTIVHGSSDDEDDRSSSKEGPSSPAHLATHEVFPESQRFLETPVTAEKRRDAPNLETTTPSLPRNPLAADLGSSGGMMALSLSQLFKATQATSSPFANRLPSGPLYDRPSPNVPIEARPIGLYTSSPSRTPRAHLTRTHTDPLSYVPMDESQKLRDKLSEERRTKSAENMDSEDRIDTDFDEEPSFVRRMNRQRKINNETDIRLASVTHGRSSSDLTAKSTVASSNRQSRDEPSVKEYDTQGLSAPFNTEGISEEETEKEDNVEIPTSQTRQAIPSSEEDKENYVGPFTTTPGATSLAHDRLSQALDLQNGSTLTDTPPAELSLLASENDLVKMSDQVINVRDSQPSPSQQSTKHTRTRSLLSQPELEQIHSSYDDSSPPRKRQRQRYIVEPGASASPIKQLVQQNSQLSSSVQSSNHSRHRAFLNDQQFSTQNAQERTSSMPSLVANTPVNKIREDTIPETSIPESSTAMVAEPNRLPTMQEADREDFDLPTPRHLRQRGSFIRASSHGGSSQALGDHQPRRNMKFISSSPTKRAIKTLSEISAEQSPQAGHDDEIYFDILNKEDREFSKTVESRSHRTPRQRLRVANDTANPQVGSSPLAIPDSSRGDNTVHGVNPEPQPDDPESPEPSSLPVIARRHHGRLSRRSEHIFEMDGSSPHSPTSATTPRPLRIPQRHQLEEQELELPTSGASKFPGNSSQRSFNPISADSVQAEQMVRDTSVVSSRNLSNTNTQAENATSDIESPAPEDTVIAPNQVLAFWNGRKRAYFPATYLRPCGPQRCLVSFVDSGPVEVPLGSVKKLQLRVGDAIKVDLPNVPKVTHIVRGFSQQLKPEDLLKKNEYGYFPVTDIYGFSHVILAAKQRKSLPGGSHLESEQTIEIPIYSIYLDMILWNQMKGRAFTPDKKTEATPSIVQTPSRGASTPVSPGSKFSRSHLIIREGLFSGMVFAVSFGSQDVTKARLTNLIVQNGGHILQDGFEELFDFPSNVPPVTQTGTSSQTSGVEEAIHFHLAPKYEDIRFTCLIADKHSRRAKYMQALALNLPCLSGRWIEDCASQNRIISWEHYLLPAGESKYLYGAIKSRVLTPFSAERATLTQMIDGRAKLLEGQSVLLVLGRGKMEERRKAYLFLAYALGAVRVGRVLDLKAGKAMLHEHARNNAGQHGWDWLYVDDHEEAAAEEMIMSKSLDAANASRKRKRSSMFAKSFGDDNARDEASIQVMSNESVCQSLILGKIYK